MILKLSILHADFQFHCLPVLFDVFLGFVLLGMHDKLADFDIIGVPFQGTLTSNISFIWEHIFIYLTYFIQVY